MGFPAAPLPRGLLGHPHAEERFRLTFENAPIGLGLVSPDGEWLLVNRALCRIVGYDEQTLTGMSFQQITHPDDLDTDLGLMAEVLSGERESYTLDKRYVRADGSVVPIRLSVSLVRDAAGTPVQFVAQIEDRSEIHEARARFEALVEHSSDALVVVDEQATVVYASPAYETLVGLPRAATVGVPFGGRIHPDDVETVFEAFGRLVDRTRERDTLIYRFQAATGAWRWVETTCVDRRDDPAIEGFVAAVRDVTERVAMTERARERALHDELTGLPNRMLLRDRLEASLADARARDQRVIVIFFDLDDFKQINDTLGHSAGDELLRAVAERARGALRASDTVARVGGDEFVVVMDGVEPARVDATLGRGVDALMKALREPFIVGDRVVDAACSAGAVVTDGSVTVEDLLRDADIAMYEAKAAGRNQWVLHEPDMSRIARDRFEARAELRAAIDDGRVVVEYQSIVDLDTRETVGAEALARLEVDGQLVYPDRFIAIAEEGGLIVQLGEIVLTTACRAAVASAQGFITVNVSARQLVHPEFAGSVLRVLERTGLAPARLVLEVTETAMLSLGLDLEPTLSRLTAAGVRFALDDFGTGWSSLTHLRSLPLSFVKVDRSFICGLSHRTPRDVAVVRAVIDLARALDIAVIAEGVEHEAEAIILTELGAEHGQGYLFARPTPALDLAPRRRAVPAAS